MAEKIDDRYLKCPSCKVTVRKDRIRIFNRCHKKCPLHDMVETEWKTWTPEEPLKKVPEQPNDRA